MMKHLRGGREPILMQLIFLIIGSFGLSGEN